VGVCGFFSYKILEFPHVSRPDFLINRTRGRCNPLQPLLSISGSFYLAYSREAGEGLRPFYAKMSMHEDGYGYGDVLNEQTKSLLGFGSCGELWDKSQESAASPEPTIRELRLHRKHTKKSAIPESSRNEERI
jgi:hypothetical protein